MKRYLHPLFILALLSLFCHCTNPSIDFIIEQLYQQARENAKSLKQEQTVFFRQAKLYEQQTNKNELLAKLAHIKAIYYHKKTDTDSALICLENGLSLLKKDSEIKYELLINAARDAVALKHYARFEDYLAQAERLSIKFKKPQCAADCYGARGLCYMHNGKYQEARKYLEQADSILAANSITKDRDYYQYVLGKSYYHQRLYPSAFNHFLNAEKLALKNGNNYQLLLIDQSIARLYRTQRRYDEALKWQEKHLNLAQEQNNRKEIRSSLEGLAIIYTEKGDTTKANELFHKSLDEARKLGNAESIAVALTNLGQFNSRLKNDEQAIQYYQESLKYKRIFDVSSLSIIRTYQDLGEAYAKTGKTEQAKEIFQKALLLSDSLESTHWKAQINKSIYELYKQEGNYPKAIEFVTSYFRLQNEADRREADDKLKELMIQYESREKDQQIVLQKQMLKTSNAINIAIGIGLLLLITFTSLFTANKKIRNKAVASIYKYHLQTQHKQELILQLLNENDQNLRGNQEDNKLLKKLIYYLEEEQVFRQKDLSLEKMAQQLGTNITYVSQLINKEFGCNFNALINHHRIMYCKKIISMRATEPLLMKEVGFEAGFSSQSTFYAAFKNEVGITPLQFLKTVTLHQKS